MKRIYEVIDTPDKTEIGNVPVLIVRPTDDMEEVVAFKGDRIWLTPEAAEEYLRGNMIKMFTETQPKETTDMNTLDNQEKQDSEEFAGLIAEIWKIQVDALLKEEPTMDINTAYTVAATLSQPIISSFALAGTMADLAEYPVMENRVGLQ